MGTTLFTIFEIVGIVGVLGAYVLKSMRARAIDNGLYVAVGLLCLFWVESPYSYVTYAVYNPKLPRFPHGLGPINQAWGNLPVLTPGGYVAYFMIGGSLGVVVARQVARQVNWSWPKVLLLSGWVAGFVWDMVFENLGTWLNVFHYERAAPGLVLFPGEIHQFPVYISISIASQSMLVAYLLGRPHVTGESASEPVFAGLARRIGGGRSPRVLAFACTIVAFQVYYLALAAPNVITKSYKLDPTHISRQVYSQLANQPR